MKYFTGAHAAFFQAALEDWPTPALEWLAEDLPTINDMLGVPRDRLIDRDSLEWKEICCNAYEESLPDYCVNCDSILGEIPGGNVRDGCPRCIDSMGSLYEDATLRKILRLSFVLAAATNHDYFSEFVCYLLCCHIKWRSLVDWQPKPKPIPKPKSLLEKLR